MKKLVVLFLFSATVSFAQSSVDDSRKDLVSNLSSTSDYSMFTNALNVSGLSQTIKSNGPFTLFAPTDKAFEKMNSSEDLMKTENKEKLTKLLSNHILTGKYTSKSIKEAIEQGKGKAEFKTLSGGTVVASLSDNAILLTDEAGNTSRVTMPDQNSENGIIHIIDTAGMAK
ncbi:MULTISPECIES: fasciclin domain-containing protein [unclassified Siphonobacter]|uniref:fasciclin domain-containing protein n=1 Tax=unclassified Siphonobacter TaxID=2635712 RepID=UPI000CAF6562|nr:MULTISPECIES: fasciclin domain-containing protein [unclassified Siphonobacter]MDQ1088870.1 putative surface protein with fasciclin (FAS1) repeats [Siphonobacter sp. SORGH_AS_1065]MDR6195053.1 putative surface protein with fasciclin (FAS1) repeats [Siphonobacter sp. SORGH_AS_0500]PKK38410.1 hypothetical protein BWI96_01145 [Siphonobacter sp. SORGH_AS_0500]